MARMRVEALAARSDLSVDTIRYYQTRGLLQPPHREGRVAWYDEEHLARLRRIRDLADRGLTLAIIGRVLAGELDLADQALAVAAVDTAASFPIEELARRSGIPLAVLNAVSREGFLTAEAGGYSDADVDAAQAGLALLEAGLALPDLLELARQHHASMRAVAERAVDLFDAQVRQPLRQAGLAPEDAAARLVDAFDALLPATMTIVAHHFRRTLLAVAVEHMERVGDGAELRVVREATS